MNLPNVIGELIKAQDNFDSFAYANCFSETAEVVDEGKTHKGRPEIQNWISYGNEKYKTVMKPIGYTKEGTTDLLTAEISGVFDGSPIVLKYHFELENSEIKSLKITS
jgi:hypothetical protein